MSYDLPVKRCFNLEDHPEHSWEYKDELHKCPGMPIQVNKWGGTQQRNDLEDVMTITINRAFKQGRAAVQGAHNPYSQREGEPWHVENQDQLFDAWARGYRSEHDKK